MKNYLIAIVISFSLLGCISLNSHQTGRSLGKKNHSNFVTVDYGEIKDIELNSKIDSTKFVIVELGAFHGITETLDLGLKINSTLQITGISKYQIIGSKKSKFASSVGLDIGLNLFTSSYGVLFYNGKLSIYNSYHFTDKIALTLSPSYNLARNEKILIEEDPTTTYKIYGYSVGLIFGQKKQLSIELSQFKNNEPFRFDIKPIVSLGYSIKFGDKSYRKFQRKLRNFTFPDLNLYTKENIEVIDTTHFIGRKTKKMMQEIIKYKNR